MYHQIILSDFSDEFTYTAELEYSHSDIFGTKIQSPVS